MATVLFVDDEPRITGFVQRGLRAFGLDVQVENDSRAALDQILEDRFDLVLMDLMMPGLDGVALLRRTIEALPGQRVIVLSAIGDVRSKVRCLELGAVDYLAKPFDLEELAARVHVHLRARKVETGAVRRAGRVKLDLEQRTADAGRGPVVLTAREFDLLRLLVDRGGEVRTRTDLLDGVWGSERAGANVVEACVRRLRSKLGADAIETVRNVGYRIADA
jgi:two-component system OmpR family response regulator